ncbi:MAG: HAD family hydrolase [Sumerlaeia bacterium]
MSPSLLQGDSDTRNLSLLSILPHPRKYKWVLFDLDMTLWNHDEALQAALLDLTDKLGLDFHAFRGAYKKQSILLWDAFKRREIDIPTLRFRRLSNAFQEVGAPKSPREIQDLMDYYLSIYHSYAGEMAGSFEVMRLAAMFSKLGILTNASRELQTKKLQQLRGNDLLTLILTVDETGCPKTDPNFYREAERQMNYPHPERVLYIGDSWVDDVVPSFEKGWNTVWINTEGIARPDKSVRVPQIKSIEDLIPFFSQVFTQE